MRMLDVSVREARMCVDRILLTCGIPSGYVHGVRECVLLSEAMGLGGFRHLLDDHGKLKMSAYESVRATDDAVDGGGIHAWLLLPSLVDLAVDGARKSGNAFFSVKNILQERELGVAAGLARRYGAEIRISENTLEAKNTSRPRTAEQWDPLLWRAMLYGFPVEESLWRAVHRLSNTALAPDSVVSRRHAGPVVLSDEGKLLGRIPQDDDFDMNMLKKVSS